MKKINNYKGYYLKLNKTDDADVIERLNKKDNKQGYIKELIRDDITLDIFREGVENGTIKIAKSDNNQDI